MLLEYFLFVILNRVMPWLLLICIFFSDFLHLDMSLLLLTVTLRGVSNKHCLLSLFSFLSNLHKNLCCGYSIESPCRGDSNEHPQHRFFMKK